MANTYRLDRSTAILPTVLLSSTGTARSPTGWTVSRSIRTPIRLPRTASSPTPMPT